SLGAIRVGSDLPDPSTSAGAVRPLDRSDGRSIGSRGRIHVAAARPTRGGGTELATDRARARRGFGGRPSIRAVSRRSCRARRARAPQRGRNLMRILFIVHAFPPGSAGGTETYARDIATVLAAMPDHHVAVLAREADASRPQYGVRREE